MFTFSETLLKKDSVCIKLVSELPPAEEEFKVSRKSVGKKPTLFSIIKEDEFHYLLFLVLLVLREYYIFFLAAVQPLSQDRSSRILRPSQENSV